MTPERAVRRPTAAERAASSAVSQFIDAVWMATTTVLLALSALLWAATPAQGWVLGICAGVVIVKLLDWYNREYGGTSTEPHRMSGPARSPASPRRAGRLDSRRD